MNQNIELDISGLEEAFKLFENFFNAASKTKSYELVSVRLRSSSKQLWQFAVVNEWFPDSEIYFEEIYIVSVEDKIVKLISG